MNLKQMSDSELLLQTQIAATDERRATTNLLHHLNEVDRRRLYSKSACDSLFSYCVRILKMSEPQGARRVNAARLLSECPEIEEKICSGLLTLTAVSQAQTFLKKEKKQDEKSQPLPNQSYF